MLDKVLTVAVGRNQSDGSELPDNRWQEFRSKVKSALEQQGIVVAVTSGGGIGSDGLNDGSDEESAVFVTINPKSAEEARKSLAELLPEYGQGSACFAYDQSHEPVFATENGYRG